MLVESWQEDEFENGKKDAELESEKQPSFSALGSLDEGAHSELPRVPNSHDKFDKHYQPSKSILAFCYRVFVGPPWRPLSKIHPYISWLTQYCSEKLRRCMSGCLILDESGIASSVLAVWRKLQTQGPPRENN
jgi:hypothetical protein